LNLPSRRRRSRRHFDKANFPGGTEETAGGQIMKLSNGCGTVRERQQIVRRFNDLTGKLFGSLKVLAYAGTDRHGRRKWRVCCARCGDEKIALAANLLSGRSKTCGCVQREKARQRMTGAARVSKVLGPGVMEAYAWDGAEEYLAQARAEIDAIEKASKPTTD
jgi:hypothetical protein